MTVEAIPEGYHTVTPYLLVSDAAEFIDFATAAFDATELERSARPDGTVMHAAIRIGNSNIMIGGANEDYTPNESMLYLYVPDVDATYKQAVEAGAESRQEPADQFYGDRTAAVSDRWGNQWWMGTHVEDVSADEIARRAREQGR